MLDREEASRKRLDAEGAILTTVSGKAYSNPLVRLVRQSASDFASLVAKLGLDVEIKAVSEADAREEAELEALLRVK